MHQNNPVIPLVLFIAVILIASLASITADMYVPAMPFIAKTFNSSAATIQYTFFSFMVGYSFAHLFYGPLSDRIGRRKPILAGISLSLCGTLLCFVAPSASLLIVGRFVQGIGVAVCNSVGRSFIRDIVTGNQLAKISSHLGMVMVFVLTMAPTIGGYIQHYWGWRAIFLVLLIYTLVTLIFIWKKLPETNFSLNPHATQLTVILKNYFTLLTNNNFIGYTISAGCAYAGIISYATCGPFLLQNIVGLTPIQYGWLTFIIGGAIFTSFFANSLLVIQTGFKKMILIGNCFMLVAGLTMFFLASMGFINAWVVILPVGIFCIGAGLTFANAFAGASQAFPQIAGSAGALFGCLQILGGAVASGIIASLHVNNQFPLAILLTILGALSLILVQILTYQDG